MLLARVYSVCLLLLYVAAQPSAAQDGQTRIDTLELRQNFPVSVERYSASEFRITARKATLRQAIDEIVKKSGVTVHYSTLPEKVVTVDCKGALKPVLDCLLGATVDRVFRNGPAGSEVNASNRTVEVWLLQRPEMLSTVASFQDDGVDLNAADNGQEQADNTDLFLQQAKNPSLRMEAIANLALAGRKDDLNVRSMLKQALSDKNPGVRAQAVFALARREGEGAFADIRRAMQDDNADVRRMALESAGNDAVLLQQALNDNDADIRQYAATKLALLNNAGQQY